MKVNLTIEQIESMGGHCDTCGSVIKIYRYKINKQIVRVLKAMNEVVKISGENKVNFTKLDNLPYRLQSQRTKMRLHGLIARVKHKDGTQVPNTWLITRKGFDFLNGSTVQEIVVVFNNTVLGHEGRLVSINQVTDELEVIQNNITTPEAEVYKDVRKPKTGMVKRAVFKGRRYDDRLETGREYEIVLDKLMVGRMITLLKPFHMQYRDISAFQNDWRIV